MIKDACCGILGDSAKREPALVKLLAPCSASGPNPAPGRGANSAPKPGPPRGRVVRRGKTAAGAEAAAECSPGRGARLGGRGREGHGADSGGGSVGAASRQKGELGGLRCGLGPRSASGSRGGLPWPDDDERDSRDAWEPCRQSSLQSIHNFPDYRPTITVTAHSCSSFATPPECQST